jgi:hypothetical protein
MREKDNGTGIGGKFTTGKIDEEEKNGLGNKVHRHFIAVCYVSGTKHIYMKPIAA